MGADNPKLREPETKTQTPFPLILIGLAVLLAGIVLFPKIDFEDKKAPKLPPKEEEKLRKRLREIDDSEQYALLAVPSGEFGTSSVGTITETSIQFNHAIVCLNSQSIVFL